MVKGFFLIFFVFLFLSCSTKLEGVQSVDKIIKATKRIEIKGFQDVYNPSLLEWGDGFLLTFRVDPERNHQAWIAYIGIIELDSSFNPISEPEILKTRTKNSKTPSQSEDARIFSYKGRVFLVYNDNIEVTFPGKGDRRDMYLVELFKEKNRFSVSSPLKLFYEKKAGQFWQKNWVPFEYNDTLFFSYSIQPHEVVCPNLRSGQCYFFHETKREISWNFGELRGGTPALLVDGEYLAFFHSGTVMASPVSWGIPLWHYFMGAYTFSAQPPFEITKISAEPLIGSGFYTFSSGWKRVIFPGGFVVRGSQIYLAYGKDDCEVWIATIDKEELMKSLITIK